MSWFAGRGSHVLLRDFPCTLHVWVTASLERRIRELLNRGWPREAAARAIKQSDDERSALVKFAFGVDWEDPTRNDLVLNMDKLSMPVAVSTVLHVVRSPAVSDGSGEALRALGMLALARRAEAALLEATVNQSFSASLSVAMVSPGTVRVSGDVETPERRAEAEGILRGVQGVEPVENAIRVMPRRRADVSRALARKDHADPSTFLASPSRGLFAAATLRHAFDSISGIEEPMVKKNVAPASTAPSAHTRPLWRWTIRFTVARPIPVPGN